MKINCRSISFQKIFMTVCMFIFLTNVFFSHGYSGYEQDEKQPVLNIPKKIYDFGLVVEGEEVVHDYVVQNSGASILEIQKVKTGRGCTVASYSRQILPGGEGKISIKVDTKGNGGKQMKKSIVVTTNDLENETFDLIVKGMVDKLVTITPGHIRLDGQAGESLFSEVLIVPEKKYSFKVVEALTDKGDNIEISYKEIAVVDGRLGYKLRVSNKRTSKGRYMDTIILKTTSKYRPTISLGVMGKIV